MSAALNSAEERRGAAERALLGALCQGSLRTRARETILRRLGRHHFSTREHEVIFQAASGSYGEAGASTREGANELLMASLTRLGFPDIDLAPFFGAPALAEADLPALFSDL